MHVSSSICLQLHTVSPWNELQQASERPAGEEARPHRSHFPINCSRCLARRGAFFSLPLFARPSPHRRHGHILDPVHQCCWSGAVSVWGQWGLLYLPHTSQRMSLIFSSRPLLLTPTPKLWDLQEERPSPNKTQGTNRLLISHELSVCYKQHLQISYWMCRPLKQTDIPSEEW